MSVIQNIINVCNIRHAEMRKPLLVMLREARAYFRGKLTAKMVDDIITKIDAALAQYKEGKTL